MSELPGRQDIYEAARGWRDTCLRDDGSILSGERIWTSENAALLVRYFIDQPDVGSRTFEEKLEDQLRDAPAHATRLAAEMLWLMMLFPSDNRESTKRGLVMIVWGWSGSPLAVEHPALRPFTHGIGSGRPGFNTFRPFELQLVVRFTFSWKALSSTEQDRLLADGWAFAAWFDELPDARNRQFRNMLLHLLFPNDFERCSSANDKKRLERAFLPRLAGGRSLALSATPLERDRRIQQIRRLLESELKGVPIDFYSTPEVRQAWNPTDEAVPTAVAEVPPDDPPAVSRARRVWLISAGVGGSQLDGFLERGEIAIGWDAIGDLEKLRSLDDMRAAIQRVYDPERDPVNNALACYEFAHVIQPGDEVYVKQGSYKVLARGTVTGEYQHLPPRGDYPNVRRVEWTRKHEWRLPEEHRLPTKTLTEITDYALLLTLLRGRDVAHLAEMGPPRPYSVDDVMREAFLQRKDVEAILDGLRRRKNVILQGPPGVGKSFLARKLAYALIGQELVANVKSVQFHQSYSYDDFMQGYRPSNGTFEIRNGAFYRFCRDALESPLEKFVFIIDEINRGNLSKIFGELMFLIEADKRGPEHALQLTYSVSGSDTFFVPTNVHVIGLMNTADRSLAMVDYALRRRFAFQDLRPAIHSPAFGRNLASMGVDAATIRRIRENVEKVNERIRRDHQNLGPGFEIGHSYFCPVERVTDPSAWYTSIVEQELSPLLTEYWFDDPKAVEACRTQLLANPNG